MTRPTYGYVVAGRKLPLRARVEFIRHGGYRQPYCLVRDVDRTGDLVKLRRGDIYLPLEGPTEAQKADSQVSGRIQRIDQLLAEALAAELDR
jgi:hypothetical protein